MTTGDAPTTSEWSTILLPTKVWLTLEVCVLLLFVFQGWLNHRNPQEAEIIMTLFSSSFPDLYRYAIQSLTFKMDILEAFVIKQVGYLVPKLIVI